ncbi:sulfatase-like hydrolase/transferase [Kluyvera ascorbata]
MSNMHDQPDLSRRRLLAGTGLLAAGAVLLPGAAAQTLCPPSLAAWDKPFTGEIPESVPAGYNILLITSDQEHYFDAYPFPVPGRERLLKMGTSFTRHHINTAVCTPSRSVMYTGLHMPQTRMFDNLGLPWMPWDLDPALSIGHKMQRLGYYAAYKGKWHLTTALDEVFEGMTSRDTGDIRSDRLHQDMEKYGFNDYHGIGDIIGMHLGGYHYDGIVASQAVNWLRSKGRQMTDQKHPWFMAVNLVNPHDVMFLDTDAPDERVQWRKPLNDANGMDPVRPPENSLYQQSWPNSPLPESRHQAFDEPGRPPAQGEYQRARAAMVGQFPDEDRRWRKLQDYYYNCIRDCDKNLVTILNELDALNLTDKTIVVFTADHGELGGNHQMHGKGTCVYRQQVNVPLVISHPAYPGGQKCQALTCHLDLAPTLLGLTGLPDKNKSELKGKDLSHLLRAPQSAGLDEVRSAILYCYNMILYVDAKFLERYMKLKDDKSLSQLQMKQRTKALLPDFSHRSAIRMVFDGRYKFARYFSLREHNTPETWEQLLALNDLELYDLQTDPGEQLNLAINKQQHKQLIMTMNEKLNALYAAEIGIDDGHFMPEIDNTNWDLTAKQFQQIAND